METMKNKIIPIFYLPKENPEDIRLLLKGLTENDGQTLKSVVTWLQGKLIAHSGPRTGQPMKEDTIKRYLYGIYALDLFKADHKFYRDIKPRKRVSVPIQAEIRVDSRISTLITIESEELFKRKFTQICFSASQLLESYSADRQFLKENFGLGDNFSIDEIRKLLLEHCGYSYAGSEKSNKSVGYLEIFYQEKIQIDNYLSVLNFIVKNFSEIANKNLGLVPIADIMNRLKSQTDHDEETLKLYIQQLQLTNQIELRSTKSQLAKNMNIELVDISGVKYGFVKIPDLVISLA